MANFGKIKKRGIKSVWIISYLIIFLFPLAVSLIAGAFVYDGFKNQIKERNEIVLESVCAAVDTHLEDIVDTTLQLNNNEYVKEISSFNGELSSNQNYVLYDFTQNFRTIRGYETVETYSDTFFVFFSGIDYVAFNGAAVPSDNYYLGRVNSSSFTKKEWNEFLVKKHNGTFFNANVFSESNELLFTKTLYPGYDDSYVTVVFKINTDRIFEEAKELYRYEYGSFSLSDSNGNTIVNGEKILPDSARKLLSFEVASEVTGWKYTYTLPKNKAYGTMYIIFVVAVLLYVLCLVVGLLLIRYFIYRNYKPIDMLMTLFPENEKGEDNEFLYLNEKITESLSSNMALNKEIDNQSKMIREHLVGELLAGNIPVGKRIRSEIEKLQFDAENDSFVVLVYSFAEKDIEELSMKQFVLSNVTDELLNDENYRFASNRTEADVVYVIAAETEQHLQKIAQIAQFLLSFTRKEFEFEFFSALGTCHKSVKNISKSYNEAKRAVEYAISTGRFEMVEYNEIATSLQEGYFYSIELETQLMNFVKANEKEKISVLLDEIFVRNIREDVSLDSVRYLMTELFETVKRIMIKYGHSPEIEYPYETEFIEKIFECRDMNKMQQVIRGLYIDCSENVFGAPSRKDELTGGIIKYINQNFSHQDLSVRHIGEAFSMNPDYVSRKFREATGKSISEFLSDVRVEKAKQLLRESDELIADIAEMVGFTSYRTFVRVFTEIVGVTPNKFKTMK